MQARGDDARSEKTDADTDQAADDAEQNGFEEKLALDVAFAGADGESDADLAGPFGDGDEHDVHDADAADEQRDAGDGAEQPGHDFRSRGGELGDFLLGANHEVVVAAGLDAVALAEQIGNVAADLFDLIGRSGAEVDGAQKILPEKTAHGSCVRHEHSVILILAHHIGSLGREKSDDGERRAVDADHGTDWVGIFEELFRRGLAEDGDAGAGADVLFGDEFTVGEWPGAQFAEFLADAEDAGVPVEIAGNELGVPADVGAHVNDAVDLFADGERVVECERGCAGHTGADATRVHVSGHDHDDVLAEAGDLLFNLYAGTDTDADHRDHRADADDDAEHGEECAHDVASKGSQRNAKK